MYFLLKIGTARYGNIYWYKYGAHKVKNDLKGNTRLMMTLGHEEEYAA